MVGVIGFEPTTPSSRTRCSTRLSHTPTLAGVITAGPRHRKLVRRLSIRAGAGPQVGPPRYDRHAIASTPRPSSRAARCALFRSRRQAALLTFRGLTKVTFRGLINERQIPLDPRETHQLSRVAVRPKGMSRAALAAEWLQPPDRLRLRLGLGLGLGLRLGLGLGLRLGLGHCQHSLSYVLVSRMPPFLAAGHYAGLGTPDEWSDSNIRILLQRTCLRMLRDDRYRITPTSGSTGAFRNRVTTVGAGLALRW